MFTQSRRTAVYDSWSPRPRVHKENESASLLIPSTGRDKLSPLMKSFRRLHAGSVRLCLRVCWEGLSMWTAHTMLLEQDLDVRAGYFSTGAFVHTRRYICRFCFFCLFDIHCRKNSLDRPK